MTLLIQKQKPEQYFHEDVKFDFEKFYYSMYGFTDPIVYETSLYITTMFIYWDEEKGRPYGQYRIPDVQKKKSGFLDEATFLESYKLYLDDTENEEFTIYQAYHHFKRLSLEPQRGRFHQSLEPQNLDNYFGLDGDNIPAPEDIDFSKRAHTIDNFILAEQILLKNLIQGFNPETSIFLPLPIICQGDLAGMVYYIYDRSRLKAKAFQEIGIRHQRRFLILAATREYETNLLESNYSVYDFKPKDPLLGYYHIFKDLAIDYSFKEKFPENKKWRKIITNNQFLDDLGYDDYYNNILSKVLIKESEQIVNASQAHIKSAIISIIVDSFAHNIGAHSLVALKWYFEQRFKAMSKKFSIESGLKTKSVSLSSAQLHEFANHPANDFHRTMNQHFGRKVDGKISILDIIRYMPDQIQAQLFSFYDELGEIITQAPIPLASSVYRFFEYLRDKSAFWSGVTRDTVFSGLVMSWTDLLIEFFNNTLFLGTITHSEGINKIHVHVEILVENEHGQSFVKAGGEFAIVDLRVIRNKKLKRGKGSHSPYAFLRKGDHFKVVYEALNELEKVFLPNGVIGQHALYTILENTLRNIKHYKKHLKRIRKEGVIFCISIQPTGFTFREKHERTKKAKLYKVGTWLHIEQELINKGKAYINEEKNLSDEKDTSFHHKSAVIHDHMQQLRRRVVDRNGQAILGGSSQDKVCSCMLMNNTFKSIDEIDLNKAKKHYYPYIFAASEPYTLIEQRLKEDFILNDICLNKIYNPELADFDEKKRKEKYKEVVKCYITEAEKYKTGIIKKYFHLWIGRKCKVVSSAFEKSTENLSRFQLIVVDKFIHKDKNVPYKYKSPHTYDSFESLHEEEKKEERKKRRENALFILRNQGILRVIEANKEIVALSDKEEQQFSAAQLKWLGEWLGGEDEQFGLLLQKPRGKNFEVMDSLGAMIMQKQEGKWTSVYYNKRELRARNNIKKINIQNIRHTSLKLDHAEKKTGTVSRACCLVRSHGAMMNEIFDGYSIDGKSEGVSIGKAQLLDITKQAKLLETCLTNISIFDNRIYERMQAAIRDGDDKRFEEQMNLRVFNEGASKHFFLNRETLLQKPGGHFMIIHLSYLETMYRTENMLEQYTENDVEQFFQEQIADFYLDTFKKPLPDNFILIITSGRGRGDWFTAIEHPQITFRPIESLVNAVEDGIYLRDDFQIKYNLCNVIFGS